MPVVCSNSPFLRSSVSKPVTKVLWPRDRLPKASEVHFLGPDVGIEALAPIFIQDEFVSVIDDCGEAVVDEVACNGKAQSKSDQGYDGDPFLPGVLGCLPRMVHFTLLHPSRAEVFLVLLLLMEVNGRGVLGGAQWCCGEGISWSGTDIVTASMASRVEGATSVGGLLRCLVG